MDPYRLTPDLKAKLEAMSYDERRTWWDEQYPDYVKSLPVADLLVIASSKNEFRFMAQEVLVERMRQAGLLDGPELMTCRAPCCGSVYRWESTQGALNHIKHSPCPSGFSLVEGKCVCDCKRTFDTPQEANDHQRRVGNCLVYRRERQALFCTLCEHQCQTKKDLEAHKTTKSHLKLENPINLICDVCEVKCRTKKEFDRHCEGKLHKFRTDPATRPTLTCSACKVVCSSQRKYEAHLETAKHLKKTMSVSVVVKTNGPD